MMLCPSVFIPFDARIAFVDTSVRDIRDVNTGNLLTDRILVVVVVVLVHGW